MTVWAVNLTADDTSAALQYGDIKHINLRYVYGDEIENERMPREVYDALQRVAVTFNRRTDYLLIVGDHMQLVAFAALLGRWQTEVDLEISPGAMFRVLRWDRKAEGYIPCWV